MEPDVTAALVTDPTQVAALLAAVLGAVFALSRVPALDKLFRVIPPVIWAYFVPMLLTTAGVTPAQNAAYDWFGYVLLPFALFLLMITIDLRAILSLGRLALLMMVVGTLGIVIGGPVAYLAVGQFLGGAEAWQGMAALAGSWIGGTANMVALQESVGLSDAGLAPIIVVDTVVGYGWLAVLLFLSGYQERFDRWVGADTKALDRVNATLREIDQTRQPSTTATVAMIVGLGVGAAVLSRVLGGLLPALGDPTIISGGTWAVLIAVTAGLALSFTPVRTLERDGASQIGFAGLYLLLTSIGATADLAAVLQAPAYLLMGVVWLSVHIALLFLAAKLLRAPLFFVATGSMANVGGAASAPIVAGVYLPAMAPVGLLMAVAGYVLGIYAALGCAWMLGQLAG
ncbi:DUF819 family protein [Rubrivirga sp. S365]|uniref:DUF819 family protein n=1 Tax=Rubrivirga litoralis TaxID=3075598 RepID=A0ABU3BLP4_9BACT|nr:MULTISPECIES: DUF819 family protein [unclassified Rubrivirga]MDT0630202.1 DUF819 family protein [Rubrivirga sp. F394]MDT7855713.1 DUF819 family protein [Rubrivirga sp. S365]